MLNKKKHKYKSLFHIRSKMLSKDYKFPLAHPSFTSSAATFVHWAHSTVEIICTTSKTKLILRGNVVYLLDFNILISNIIEQFKLLQVATSKLPVGTPPLHITWFCHNAASMFRQLWLRTVKHFIHFHHIWVYFEKSYE